MTPVFKMRPRMLNGVPVSGGMVRIPIRFTLPKPERPGPPPDAGSPEAMKQALRMVDSMAAVDRMAEGMATLDPSMSASGAPAATVTAAMDTIRKAAAARKAEMREVLAKAFASMFSEEEMQAIADFSEGPGKRLQANDAIGPIQDQIRTDFRREQRTAARGAFCAKVACGDAAALEQVWRPGDPRDRRLDNPQWAASPSDYALRRAAPVIDAIGVTGAVRLTCTALETGRLGDCESDEELPRGLGLGVAAVAAAEDSYRLSPIQLAAGGKGRKVTVRVGFTPTALAEPGKPPEPRSPRTLELARRVVDSEELERNTRRDIEVEILKFQSPQPKGVDAKVYEAAIEAYRTGALAALEASRARQVTAWASAYDEPDLTALAAFRATPGYKAQKDRGDALGVAMTKAATYVANRITDDARAAFCATRVCEADAPPATPTAAKP